MRSRNVRSKRLERLCVHDTVELAVLEPGDCESARRELAALERTGAMVTGLDAGRFRVHPMLNEAIRQRTLARDGEQRLAQLHEDAGRSYARAGRIEPALFHLTKAARSRPLVEFLREHAAGAIDSGKADAIREIVTHLLGRAVDEPALFAFVLALLAKRRGGDEGLRAAFQAARELAAERGDEAIVDECDLQLVEHDLGRGRPVARDAVLEVMQRGAGRRPMEAAGGAIRAGWYGALEGNFERALALAESVPDDGSAAAAFHLGPLRAYAHTVLDEFESASRAVALMLDRLSDGAALPLYASGLIWASRLAMLRGETSEALEYALEARRVAEPFELRNESAALYLALSDAAVHAGDAALAGEAARLARRFAPDAWYARDTKRAQAFAAIDEARAAFLGGDLNRARELAEHFAAAERTPLYAALALAEAAVFAALGKRRNARALRMAARKSLAEVTPIDAGDAVALATAIDLVSFLDVLESGAEPAPLAARSSLLGDAGAPRKRRTAHGLRVRATFEAAQG